jgi:hypothetical protein
MVEIPNVSTRSIPVTPEAVADLPDQPLAEGTAGLPELSAHVAVMSRKGKNNEQLHPRAGFEGSTRKS